MMNDSATALYIEEKLRYLNTLEKSWSDIKSRLDFNSWDSEDYGLYKYKLGVSLLIYLLLFLEGMVRDLKLYTLDRNWAVLNMRDHNHSVELSRVGEMKMKMKTTNWFSFLNEDSEVYILTNPEYKESNINMYGTFRKEIEGFLEGGPELSSLHGVLLRVDIISKEAFSLMNAM